MHLEGHVNWLEIIIYRNGWNYDSTINERKAIELNKNATVIEELKQMIEILEKLKKGG